MPTFWTLKTRVGWCAKDSMEQGGYISPILLTSSLYDDTEKSTIGLYHFNFKFFIYRCYFEFCFYKQICYEVNFMPREIRMLKFEPPHPCLGMWPYLETESFRCNYNEVIRWALIQNDWCSYKKEKFGHRHVQRENPMWKWRHRSGWCFYKPKKASRQKLHEKHGEDPLS